MAGGQGGGLSSGFDAIGSMMFWGFLLIVGATVVFGLFQAIPQFMMMFYPEFIGKWIAIAWFVLVGVFWLEQARLVGVFSGMVKATTKVAAYTWPFLVLPLAVFVASELPFLQSIAPKDEAFSFYRALAPLVITFGAWIFWRFSRLQEVSRDVGAWLAMIGFAIVAVRVADSHSNAVFAALFFSGAISTLVSGYMLGYEQNSRALKTVNIFAKAMFFMALWFLAKGIFFGEFTGVNGEKKKSLVGATVEEVKQELKSEFGDKIKQKIEEHKEKKEQREEARKEEAAAQQEKRGKIEAQSWQ